MASICAGIFGQLLFFLIQESSYRNPHTGILVQESLHRKTHTGILIQESWGDCSRRGCRTSSATACQKVAASTPGEIVPNPSTKYGPIARQSSDTGRASVHEVTQPISLYRRGVLLLHGVQTAGKLPGPPFLKQECPCEIVASGMWPCGKFDLGASAIAGPQAGWLWPKLEARPLAQGTVSEGNSPPELQPVRRNAPKRRNAPHTGIVMAILTGIALAQSMPPQGFYSRSVLI